jgi:AcrR family transcriptional regulator
MSVIPNRDRRAERYQATRAEILAAAWDLVREQGLAALSMRDLGARVGMRAQSLYVYFPSKHAIYDEMFRQGNLEALARRQRLPLGPDPRGDLRRSARLFVEFCVEDPARYQLMFLRTVPGFDPSPESYAVAVQVLDYARTLLTRAGFTDRRDLDLWTGLTGGLVHQQLSNEPGGSRWIDLLDEAIDMYFDHQDRRRSREPRQDAQHGDPRHQHPPARPR